MIQESSNNHVQVGNPKNRNNYKKNEVCKYILHNCKNQSILENYTFLKKLRALSLLVYFENYFIQVPCKSIQGLIRLTQLEKLLCTSHSNLDHQREKTIFPVKNACLILVTSRLYYRALGKWVGDNMSETKTSGSILSAKYCFYYLKPVNFLLEDLLIISMFMGSSIFLAYTLKSYANTRNIFVYICYPEAPYIISSYSKAIRNFWFKNMQTLVSWDIEKVGQKQQQKSTKSNCNAK